MLMSALMIASSLVIRPSLIQPKVDVATPHAATEALSQYIGLEKTETNQVPLGANLSVLPRLTPKDPSPRHSQSGIPRNSHSLRACKGGHPATGGLWWLRGRRNPLPSFGLFPWFCLFGFVCRVCTSTLRPHVGGRAGRPDL
ncbi:hypothetical protein ASPZODRAFT_1670570 [Penicilliopsis zonata CBS 506.65]|uniref:Uncharacterized protein n=1 Tax=Penicilliopsis zonata CBS 506.65 TaxID=1073090 RepID=A0A1L9S4E2_9EURO|nr:hypothetical protein ASPZODRAFT_1670570 [Penicilliopsis zonata CBS 506.65]OJJ42038.1 hypothetical protein ASPZODRAFT_1670570 [Penicilliopsis zonata CBS 506.65]